MMSVNDISIGQKLQFRLLTPHDTVMHQGTVSSICDYESAKRYSDVDTSFSELEKAGKSVVNNLNDVYIVLKYTANGATQQTAFGRSWIDVSTLELVNENRHVDIRVYDIDHTTAETVVEAIKVMGHSADIV